VAIPSLAEDQTLQDILSWFYSCSRPPSSLIATKSPRSILGLTFPDFDLAMKQEGMIIADLIWYYAGE